MSKAQEQHNTHLTHLAPMFLLFFHLFFPLPELVRRVLAQKLGNVPLQEVVSECNRIVRTGLQESTQQKLGNAPLQIVGKCNRSVRTHRAKQTTTAI